MQNVEQVLSGLTPILVGDTQSAQILDALPVAVYATDPEGCITYYNQAAADFWGQRPDIGPRLLVRLLQALLAGRNAASPR